MLKGKINWFTRKDIHRFDPHFDLYQIDEEKLYDLCEEQMLDMGFVLFDNDLVFEKEVIINGWYERRYSCMVLKGKKRKGRFILKEVGIQFWHIN